MKDVFEGGTFKQAVAEVQDVIASFGFIQACPYGVTDHFRTAVCKDFVVNIALNDEIGIFFTNFRDADTVAEA